MNGASEIPKEIQNLKHTEVRKVFPEPTLIEIPGKTDEWVFLSTLLHGNEPASFELLKLLQKHLENHEARRSLMVFVGNVHAAEKNQRFLAGQMDFNRVWNQGDTIEHGMAGQVFEAAKEKKLFANLDVHNNTGTNPFYACINRRSMAHLKLASLFGPQVVFFENPRTVQSLAFSELCPSITVECGQPDNPDGPQKAFDLLLSLIQMEKMPEHVADEHDLHVYETQGRVRIDEACEISFHQGQGDIEFAQNFEHWNFNTLPSGFVFAESTNPNCLKVYDEDNQDITDEFIRFENNAFYLTQELIPAMLTTNIDIVQKDCLGYLMQPVDWRKFQ